MEDDVSTLRIVSGSKRMPLVSSPRRGEEICRNALPYPNERRINPPLVVFHASSHFTCSGVSAISNAERLSSSSAIVRGPISGMTGKGWAMT